MWLEIEYNSQHKPINAQIHYYIFFSYRLPHFVQMEAKVSF